MAEDLNRVSVQLSLLSGEDTKAAQQLADELKSIHGLFKTINSDFATYSKKLLDLSEVLAKNRATQQVGASEGGRSEPKREAADLAVSKRETTEALIIRHQGVIRSHSDTQLHEQQKQARIELEARAEANRAPAPVIPVSGGPKPRPGADPDDPNEELAPFTMPRYGNLTIQDYLRAGQAGARRIGKAGGIMGKGGGLATALGSSEGLFAKAIPIVGGAYTAINAVQEARNLLSKTGFDPWRNADRGGQLGFDRNSGGSFLGIQNPFNEAAKEGRRQQVDKLGLRMQAGINGEQAQAIVDSTAGAGFSGDKARDISYNLLAPMMKKYGLDPESIIPFTAAIRMGQNSVGQLTDSLKDVGSAAQAASMTVPQMTEAMQQTIETSKELGNTDTARANVQATNFARSTGLDPKISNDLAKNPYVQAITSSMTGGTLPQLQGQLSGEVRTATQLAAVDQMSQAYSNYRPRDYINPATGKLHHVTDKEAIAARDGLVASALGTDPGAIRRLRARGKVFAGANKMMSYADKYRSNYMEAREGDATIKAVEQTKDPFNAMAKREWDASRNAFKVTQSNGSVSYKTLDQIKSNTSQWDRVTEKRKDIARDMVEHGTTNGKYEWDDVKRKAEESGIWGGKTAEEKKKKADEALKDVYSEKDSEKRAIKFRDAVQKQADKAGKTNNPEIVLAFKGVAGHYFKGKAKGDWSGVKSKIEQAASPDGLRPLPQPPSANYMPGSQSSG